MSKNNDQAAAAAADGDQTRWNSYPRQDFVFDGRAGVLVSPACVAEGKPWVWRTEYFGAFAQADLAMLAHGWHLAYYNVSELFGGNRCVEIMGRFHCYLKAIHGFTALPALFGFSRGGFSAFNYAARFPGKVGLLYLDAPLLDLRSLAVMKAAASPAEGFQALLEKYPSFSAEAFDDVPLNAMDQIGQVAAAGVPILLVAGDADEVVPYEENGAVLARRYPPCGGTIEVILKPACGHHPHSLENPEPIVNFILASAPPRR
jgi:pimeloyl-ACP methyl ester carboxylesterase